MNKIFCIFQIFSCEKGRLKKISQKNLKDDFFKTKKLHKLKEENKNLSKHFFNARFLDDIYLKSKKKKNFTFNSKFTKYLDNTILEVNDNYSNLKLLLFKKKNKIRNEYYLDMAIQESIKLGLKVIVLR